MRGRERPSGALDQPARVRTIGGRSGISNGHGGASAECHANVRETAQSAAGSGTDAGSSPVAEQAERSQFGCVQHPFLQGLRWSLLAGGGVSSSQGIPPVDMVCIAIACIVICTIPTAGIVMSDVPIGNSARSVVCMRIRAGRLLPGNTKAAMSSISNTRQTRGGKDIVRF